MSKQNVNDLLESQIGDIGSDNVVVSNEKTGLGKLKHKEAYGQKEDLNEADIESLNKFLSRGKELKESRETIEISSVVENNADTKTNAGAGAVVGVGGSGVYTDINSGNNILVGKMSLLSISKALKKNAKIFPTARQNAQKRGRSSRPTVSSQRKPPQKSPRV